MKHIRTAAVLAAGFFLLAITSSAYGQAPGAIAPAQKCADLVNFKVSGTNVQITKAEEAPTAPPNTVRAGFGPETIPVAIPGFCRADGVIDPRTGADGKPYAIGFEIALPDNWNGRFLFQGGGGLNGAINPPLGAQAAADNPALARGFAVVSTDTGHKGAVFDPSFQKDQIAALDFDYLAVGRMTVLSKQIIAQYYGQAAKHSYYDGCSTGGREAMLMSQRYPMYFDGIVAGSPAQRTGYSGLATRAITVALNAAAPKDASGKPGPALSESDKKAVITKLLEECDARDGAKDGMIFDATGCTFQPRDLQCL